MKEIKVLVKKVQKKYYLSEETALDLRLAAARTGFSQSQILEAALTMHLVRNSR